MGLRDIFIKVTNEDEKNAKLKSSEFWNWFKANEERIITVLKNGEKEAVELINEIDGYLKAIFPKFKKELFFGFLVDLKLFDLAHQNSKYLKSLLKIFIDLKPSDLQNEWKIEITKA